MTLVSLQFLVIALLALIIILGGWLFVMERRLRKLLTGKGAQSLEGIIGALGGDIKDLEAFQNKTTSYLADAEKRIKRSIQGIETIRFNAFKGNGEGGNQSFAIALLSENGDGVVISSIYARDRQSIFAKSIKNFSSDHELTEEEHAVVMQARRS